MMTNQQVRIRKFLKEDIPLKVKWINNPEINKYLHYNLPLEEEKTLQWYENNKNNTNRIDNTIEILEDDLYTPVGLIGLLGVDNINKKAEFYICIGERNTQGKGIAEKASIQFINQCFKNTDLNKIYLYTEKANIAAQKLFEKVGFKKEGLLIEDLIYNEKKIDRYVYGLLREDFKYEL